MIIRRMYNIPKELSVADVVDILNLAFKGYDTKFKIDCVMPYYTSTMILRYNVQREIFYSKEFIEFANDFHKRLEFEVKQSNHEYIFYFNDKDEGYIMINVDDNRHFVSAKAVDKINYYQVCEGKDFTKYSAILDGHFSKYELANIFNDIGFKPKTEGKKALDKLIEILKRQHSLVSVNPYKEDLHKEKLLGEMLEFKAITCDGTFIYCHDIKNECWYKYDNGTWKTCAVFELEKFG